MASSPPATTKEPKTVTMRGVSLEIEGGMRRTSGSRKDSDDSRKDSTEIPAAQTKRLSEDGKKLTKKETMVKLADQKKAHDEEWEETHEAEVQAEELIEYLKDKWKVEIDRTSSLIELTMRTVEVTHHQRPENYWLLKRAQEKQAEHTGFFSSVRRPYAALGPPELDVPMLVFRNLPDTLKIDVSPCHEGLGNWSYVIYGIFKQT